jgi:hypothetical protein
VTSLPSLVVADAAVTTVSLAAGGGSMPDMHGDAAGLDSL